MVSLAELVFLLAATNLHAVVASSATNTVELGREAVASLNAASLDPDPDVRETVAASWGRFSNRAAIPILKKALRDDIADVRIAAAASLYQLGEVEGLTALIDETKVSGAIPPTTPAQELRRMARDTARARAVIRLGEIGGETARLTLKSAHGDESGEVRDAASIALARLGEVDYATPFLEAADDPDESTRAAAVRSLGLIAGPGRDVIARHLRADASATVRAAACVALAAFPGDSVVTFLLAALKDKSGRVRSAALRALGQRQEAAATIALKQILEKSPPPESALVITAALAERGVIVDLSLAELTMSQHDPELKSLAIRILGASKDTRALDLLIESMRHNPSHKTRIESAVATIKRLRNKEGEL